MRGNVCLLLALVFAAFAIALVAADVRNGAPFTLAFVALIFTAAGLWRRGSVT